MRNMHEPLVQNKSQPIIASAAELAARSSACLAIYVL